MTVTCCLTYMLWTNRTAIIIIIKSFSFHNRLHSSSDGHDGHDGHSIYLIVTSPFQVSLLPHLITKIYYIKKCYIHTTVTVIDNSTAEQLIEKKNNTEETLTCDNMTIAFPQVRL